MEIFSNIFKSAFTESMNKVIEKGKLIPVSTKWNSDRQKEFQNFTIEELLKDEYFFPKSDFLWPVHRDDIIELWHRRESDGVYVFCDNEGIGGGKTYKMAVITYLLSLEILTETDFSRYLIDVDSKIAIVIASRDAQKAREVTFKQLLPFFNSPFVNEYFRPNVTTADIERRGNFPTMLRFPNNFAIYPGTGGEAANLGYDIYGAEMDEVNYMETVSESKRSKTGEIYKAAKLIFEAIVSRMDSRFKIKGKQHGLISMASNPRYPGDFMEEMAERAQTDRRIMFVRRTGWAAHPKGKHLEESFRFDVSNLKILEADEDVGFSRVVDVPLDHYDTFFNDPSTGWRFYGDTPIQSIFPYFTMRSKVDSAINWERVNPFDEAKEVFPADYLCKDPENPRFIHIDLGVTSDAACLCMGCASGAAAVGYGKEEVGQDRMLRIKVDCIVRLKPSEGRHIELAALREIVYDLSSRGFSIQLITYDRFQSVDSIQIMKSKGYIVGNLSIDRTANAIILNVNKDEGFCKVSTGKKYTAAMDALLRCVNNEVIDIPFHYLKDDVTKTTQFQYEAKSAERIKGNSGDEKVVPALGASDDVLQVIAGMAFNCINNMDVGDFDVVASVKRMGKKYKDKFDEMDEALDGGGVEGFDYDEDEVSKDIADILGATSSEYDF